MPKNLPDYWTECCQDVTCWAWKHKGFRLINAPKSPRTLQPIPISSEDSKNLLYGQLILFLVCQRLFLVSSPHAYLATSPPSIGNPPPSTIHGWCHHERLVNSGNKQHSLPTIDWGEPAVGFKWTGWAWERTGWRCCSRLSGKLPIRFGGICKRIFPQFCKEDWRMSSTWKRLDLQTLGSQPMSMPKTLSDRSSFHAFWFFGS